MWIISSDGRLAVNSEYITKFEAGATKVTATTIANGTTKPDAYIGIYENENQTGIAFNDLLDALVDLKDGVFCMPTGNEPYMNKDKVLRGGGFEARGKKTTGKTK